jgi:hypothetical protein
MMEEDPNEPAFKV